MKYYTSGFLSLQQAIATYALVALPSRDDPNITDYSVLASANIPTITELVATLRAAVTDFSTNLAVLNAATLLLLDTAATAAAASSSSTSSSSLTNNTSSSSSSSTACFAADMVLTAAASASDPSDALDVASAVTAALLSLGVADPAEAAAVALPFATSVATAAAAAQQVKDVWVGEVVDFEQLLTGGGGGLEGLLLLDDSVLVDALLGLAGMDASSLAGVLGSLGNEVGCVSWVGVGGWCVASWVGGWMRLCDE
jgi:hypothetical protein